MMRIRIGQPEPFTMDLRLLAKTEGLDGGLCRLMAWLHAHQ